MGRFAQVLGIGVHGTVQIELPKREFFAGEFVLGHVKVNVREAIDAEGFKLTLNGKEHIAWRVKQGKHDHHHHDKHEIFRQSIPLVSAATVFSPGEYIFPFQFQLPMDLPSSHSIYRKWVDNYKRVMSCIIYKLKAEVKAKGMLTANIGAESVIGVHGFPPPPPQPITAIEDETHRPVYLLCCFDQGLCHVSSAMSSNAVDVFAGVVTLQVAVRNESKRPLSGIFVRLHQDFRVHIPTHRASGGTQIADAEIVFEKKFPGLEPGARTELSAELSMAQIAASVASRKVSDPFGDLKTMQQPHQQLPLLSTRDALFASVRYYVSVQCAVAFTPDIVVEHPLTIYLPPPMAIAMPSMLGNPEERGKRLEQ